jgi:hypothetical protein
MNLFLLLVLVLVFLMITPFAAITIDDFKNELIALYKGVEK